MENQILKLALEAKIHTFFGESDGAPPTSMLLWGAAHCVRQIIVMQMTVHAQQRSL